MFLTDDDPDAFDFSPPTTRNVEIKLPLSGCQRKLYDDYLSSSQSKLDSLDAKSIASVLQTLRKVRKKITLFFWNIISLLENVKLFPKNPTCSIISGNKKNSWKRRLVLWYNNRWRWRCGRPKLCQINPDMDVSVVPFYSRFLLRLLFIKV